MNLDLAAYKLRQGNFAKIFNESQPIPRKKPLMFKPFEMHPTDLDKFVKRLRYSTWRRKENHDKQLQFILNKEKYQQNQTWQAEYDRLSSQNTALPGLQNQINDRLDSLRNVLLR